MVRKQVYIEPRHDRMLKRRAKQQGVTEAEIIREALDRVDSSSAGRSQGGNAEAARLAVAFMRSLAHRPSEKGLGDVHGWLADDDPFFAAVEDIVDNRVRHLPRTLIKAGKRRQS